MYQARRGLKPYMFSPFYFVSKSFWRESIGISIQLSFYSNCIKNTKVRNRNLATVQFELMNHDNGSAWMTQLYAILPQNSLRNTQTKRCAIIGTHANYNYSLKMIQYVGLSLYCYSFCPNCVLSNFMWYVTLYISRVCSVFKRLNRVLFLFHCLWMKSKNRKIKQKS